MRKKYIGMMKDKKGNPPNLPEDIRKWRTAVRKDYQMRIIRIRSYRMSRNFTSREFCDALETIPLIDTPHHPMIIPGRRNNKY